MEQAACPAVDHLKDVAVVWLHDRRAVAALMLFLAGCAGSASDEPPVSAAGEPRPRLAVHEGHFTTELWRVRNFTPCGSERSWWVEGELGPVMELIGSVPRQDLGNPYRLFVRWRGSVVPNAGTAHMARVVNAFVVDSVLEARWAAAGDCQ
jgi:hypothetical protein